MGYRIPLMRMQTGYRFPLMRMQMDRVQDSTDDDADGAGHRIPLTSFFYIALSLLSRSSHSGTTRAVKTDFSMTSVARVRCIGFISKNIKVSKAKATPTPHPTARFPFSESVAMKRFLSCFLVSQVLGHTPLILALRR